MTSQLTGNAVVGQSGGPTAVINSSLCGVVQGVLAHTRIGKVYGMVGGIRGLLKGSLVDLGQERPEIIEGLRRTPSSALGSSRHKLSPRDYDQLADVFKKFDIRYFFYIGGNDSADTTLQVARLAADLGREMIVIGIPKTVDNDLALTDHCPGYGSAARYIANSALEAGLDSEAIASYPVKVIEVMGRHAGWLAAAAALARREERDAPHLVYVPERPLVLEKVVEDITETCRRIGHVVISLAEGARWESGEIVSASAEAVDAFGHRQMGGAGDVFAAIITEKTGIRSRCDRPGTLQRASIALASCTDLEEAYRVGLAAVDAAANGITGHMVTLVRESNDPYICNTGLAPIEDVANKESKLPPDYMNNAGNYPTAAFIEYARPLIGAPLPDCVRLAKVLASPEH